MAHCLWCGKKLKGNRRKFCCNKHKDRWHNVHNPRGYSRDVNPLRVRDCEVTEWDHGDNGCL